MAKNKNNIIFISILCIIALVLILWSMSILNPGNSFRSTAPEITEEEIFYSDVISLSTNSFQYESVDHMDQMAELIIIGTPTKSFIDRDHKMTYYGDGEVQDFYTLTEIHIDKILKKPDDFSQDQEAISIIEPMV